MMTNEMTIMRLKEMRLPAMADALSAQINDASLLNLMFEERLALLVDAEHLSRRNNKLYRLIRSATFDQSHATLADINYSTDRKLNRSLIRQLAACQYIESASNIIIMGASGTGKSYLACAFGLEACKHYYSAKYIRMPDLLVELSIARGEGSYPKYMKQLSKIRLLIIDDWMLHTLTELESRDVLEIIHIRHKHTSTILCSQFTIAGWHAKIPDVPLADAILDRIVHDSYTIEINSGKSDKSMREVYGLTR